MQQCLFNFYAIPIPVNILKFTAARSSVHFVLVVKLNQLTFSRQWRIFIFHLDGVDHLSVDFPAREGLVFSAKYHKEYSELQLEVRADYFPHRVSEAVVGYYPSK